MDVLIRARRERVEHKFQRNCPSADYCFWTGIKPRKVLPGDIVMFTDGERVYAQGEIQGVDEFEGLIFSPLKEVDYLQPKKAPTRGFTYVG